ncbi:hypothetical protein ACFWZ3_05415 [Frateuria sp. GZRR35]|jgi:hypothetical protein|uniref:hypothetical protein n=1 Tax=Frateuria TaxID=70411 RepID=UPI002260D3EA|nr:hypothetical protein [Frateuria sp. STR12]MCX7514247.1 hypothetical protein [Frateuria sp. STR12]
MHFASIKDGLKLSAEIVAIRLGEDEAVVMATRRGPGPSAWRALVQREAVVEDVFKYMQGPLDDWSNLGRIIEAIEHDLGGRDSLVALGWVDAQAIKTFRATANNPKVAGATAGMAHASLPLQTHPWRSTRRATWW